MFKKREKRADESINDPIVAHLQQLVGVDGVLYRTEELTAYECDGFTLQKGLPRAVVFPRSAEEVAAVVKLLNRHNVPFIPRGAGTGLSGGAIPLHNEVLISLVKMKRLLDLDLYNRYAVVEPGFVNLKLSTSIASQGYFYAPDPSSQYVCTIGGNVAENAGGAHCLKYGVTTNHVLGLEVVLPDGEIVQLGGVPDVPGYDLMGLLTGSEGTLGIVTKIKVRILKLPQQKKSLMAYFDDVGDASQAVSDIIACGIVPAALEMMDQLAIYAVESANFPVGHPTDVAAVLLVAVDGVAAGIDEQMDEIISVCRKWNVREVKVARTDQEAARWWANRKTAFGAMGAISPDYLVQDGVIPRSRLPEVLERIAKISGQSGLRIANVFHAGDGNLHPLILFDASRPGEKELAMQVGSEVLQVCAEVGGSITGEHGVGVEKKEEMRYVFSDEELLAQLQIRDVFNPQGLMNPGKLFPEPARCGEVKRAYQETHRV